MKYNTKFANKNYLIQKNYTEEIKKLKIGIHIHLYYIDMMDMFIKYLKDSPIEFDLFITTSKEENKDICLNAFNKLPKLKNITIFIVENIGRDIAPWLIECNNIQNNYDLFCHLHTKKSLHWESINEWGEYLIENLISEEAINNILSNFILDDNIGIISPHIYYYLFPYILYIDKDDMHHIKLLLNKLNINFEPKPENFVFPVGSMLWYRPKVLKPLFDLNLKYSDFPQEPIPKTGTIAHAIERIIGIICEQSNYKFKFYINNNSYINNTFALYDEIADKYYIKKYLDKGKFKDIFIDYDIRVKRNIFNILEIGSFSLFNIYLYGPNLVIILFGLKITLRIKK
ncbi:rhamnan synthesis F family protein [Brachyspira hyodysenteriae]|uniref:rhamnan synthesis F family protein n=1 Tax=Brachyspira hyodysenteriae TaxID=159 RepID=UPI00063DD758|nr:rhamnan synthesis F family protein [Brachyspira hyodysenteriae]KLI51882.1 glycosyl transferase family 1 [Brachyspira hyodysenteriae]MCZ9840560.1 rhamnan synthesis F family protein [Brachyspira hyodysenteriae]MCZ9849585.1 rhamnan synthesis F family protein [Brachyspira hyodysenteriae]MCZ9852418.1 rhamnan synthesis F family protein [Brachyspira hyodysenteriae]MCZ9862029.1 rhamnan synthesis F family protein [Brachyspira hyodysenteriae]